MKRGRPEILSRVEWRWHEDGLEASLKERRTRLVESLTNARSGQNYYYAYRVPLDELEWIARSCEKIADLCKYELIRLADERDNEANKAKAWRTVVSNLQDDSVYS